MARVIMVQGTASDSGKSILCAALCRIFRQDGYRTAPFKSQNMALNSFISADGFELGRAQAMQAESAGIPPDVRMNPILLKPTSAQGSQVIVGGKPIGTMSAGEYFKYRRELVPTVLEAYESLSRENDVIVIEGAGSPAEINLKSDDIVNMGLAERVNAPVLLVGDIDRGGVFAALYGTVKLLDASEQARIKGLIINKFRGDLEILKPGLKMLEKLLGIPVTGVIPFTRFDIDDEDSLSSRLGGGTEPDQIDIAVVRVPHISNFTDFNPLERISGVSVRYVETVNRLGQPDLIILPGSKNTMYDLMWMRQNGLEAAVKKHAAEEKPVFGICGGYQMLGTELCDPDGIEHGGRLDGLGLLPVKTIFREEKTTVQVTGEINPAEGVFSLLSGVKICGYEIHMGSSELSGPAKAFAEISRAGTKIRDGALVGCVAGTYIHGIFDEAEAARALIACLMRQKGISAEALNAIDTAAYKETQYDLLADTVRRGLDMESIYRILDSQSEAAVPQS